MFCRISDLKYKEVVNIPDGVRLGTVDDADIDTSTASLVSLVIYGRLKLFGLLGKEEDIIISWKDISIIGQDTILVNISEPIQDPHRRRSVFESWKKE